MTEISMGERIESDGKAQTFARIGRLLKVRNQTRVPLFSGDLLRHVFDDGVQDGSEATGFSHHGR